MDVRSLMRRSAQFHASREAIVFRGRRLTYAEAWDRGVRLANALLDRGLRPGDRVGVLEENSLEASDFFAGSACANLVRVPLFPRDSRQSWVHMLGHTQCKVLVTSAKFADALGPIQDELPDLEHVIVRGDDYEEWLAGQSDVDPDPPVDPEDYYVIRHTGGTTGRAKGVAYTHKRWLAAGRDWFYNFPPVELGDRCMHVGPISHGSGYLFTPIWLSGGSNVLLDRFELEETIEMMEAERIAYMFTVPTMASALAHHPTARNRDWSALKMFQIGGAPVSDETALLCRDVFGPVLYQGFGQTEALPVTMMGPREWFSEVPGSNPLRSAGRPLPFADLAILSAEDGAPVPIGEEGEIAIRCDGQMLGFWQDPEATASRMIDDWVLTGDIGKLDANGYLYVLDRKDDMIISGGFNIWPAELENAITYHPKVLEVAVVGVPDERWGERPLAVCVVEQEGLVAEDEVIALCVERLGSYKKPTQVVFQTEPLPKSAVGKLARKVIREPYWAGVDRRVAGA
jgi:acyl-CoA synthetase (AMP-forming)/AMP-acid ligase II